MPHRLVTRPRELWTARRDNHSRAVCLTVPLGHANAPPNACPTPYSATRLSEDAHVAEGGGAVAPSTLLCLLTAPGPKLPGSTLSLPGPVVLA